jgi:hypothetical protein
MDSNMDKMEEEPERRSGRERIRGTYIYGRMRSPINLDYRQSSRLHYKVEAFLTPTQHRLHYVDGCQQDMADCYFDISFFPHVVGTACLVL